MPIRVDVGILESIARQVRSGSRQISDEGRRVNSSVQEMTWKGNAYQRFIADYQTTYTKLNRTVDQMESFADLLERVAEAFRQADLEEDRRRAEQEQREREARARARANVQK
ncbi:hypothetical protein AWM70_12535 [Paenibacillus yonginensis]|uniref:WXG100 family type VII secretion target n=1 Tax=Paenibacillus yonginensis TaxID=1462996 RepID=A0A1B1N1P2_9BACL|nr:WXG100 family type VII secretion target [Paenibacillus yonginensis]ANS75331.1 hypothetical protein AWM70_12535 [Paenibacillus yonginensis]